MQKSQTAEQLEKKALSQSWRDNAKCVGLDTQAFYPVRDKDTYTGIAKYSKGVCKGKDGKAPCPVRKQCLLYAILLNEEHGIWGTCSHRERNAIERKAAKKNQPVAEWIEEHIQ